MKNKHLTMLILAIFVLGCVVLCLPSQASFSSGLGIDFKPVHDAADRARNERNSRNNGGGSSGLTPAQIQQQQEAAARQQRLSDAYNQNEQGVEAWKKGDLKSAADFFQKALQNNPDDKTIKDNLARVNQKLKEIHDNQVASDSIRGIVQDYAKNLNNSMVTAGGLDFTSGHDVAAADSSGDGGLNFISDSKSDLKDGLNDTQLKPLDSTPRKVSKNKSGQTVVNISGVNDTGAKTVLDAYSGRPVTVGRNNNALEDLTALGAEGATPGTQPTIDTAGAKGGRLDTVTIPKANITTPAGTPLQQNPILAVNIAESLKKVFMDNPQIQSDPEIRQKLQDRRKANNFIEEDKNQLGKLDLSKPDDQVKAVYLKQAIATEASKVATIDLSVGGLIQQLAKKGQAQAGESQQAGNSTPAH